MRSDMALRERNLYRSADTCLAKESMRMCLVANSLFASFPCVPK